MDVRKEPSDEEELQIIEQRDSGKDVGAQPYLNDEGPNERERDRQQPLTWGPSAEEDREERDYQVPLDLGLE